MVLVLHRYHETVLIRLTSLIPTVRSIYLLPSLPLSTPFYEYLKGFSLVLHPCCAYFLIFFLIFLQNKERLILREEKEKPSEAC